MKLTINNIVRKIREKWLVIVLSILLLAGAGAIGYLVWQNNELRNNPKTAQEAQSKKDAELLSKISKIYQLPSDETPVLGTVDDKEKLKDQPFFKDAQNGDRLVIYAKAKKAVVYRESENKIINAGPIAITSDSASGTTPSTQQDSTTNNR